MNALNIDFVVYKLSQMLVLWAELYTNSFNAKLSQEDFLELNEAVLDFDPQQFRSEAVGIDPALLPKQFGVSHGGGDRPKSGKSQTSKRPAAADSNSAPVPKSKTPRTPSNSPSAPPRTPAHKGKYICVADFLHAQNSTQYPACKRGADECNQRHVPRPAPGSFAQRDRAELLTSISRLQSLPGDKKAEMSAAINAIV